MVSTYLNLIIYNVYKCLHPIYISNKGATPPPGVVVVVALPPSLDLPISCRHSPVNRLVLTPGRWPLSMVCPQGVDRQIGRTGGAIEEVLCVMSHDNHNCNLDS